MSNPTGLAGLRRAVAERWYLRAAVGAALLTLLLAVVVLWAEFAASNTNQRVVLTFLINLVAVVAIQTFMGNSGVASFGHVAFVGLGAYTAALLTTPPATKAQSTLIPDAPSFILNAELGFVPASLVAIVVVAVIALVVGLVFVRMNGAAAAIGTLSLLVVVRSVLGNLEQITRGPKTFFGVPPYTNLWWALGFAAVVIFAARLFRESALGLRLRSSRLDELASSATGVNIRRSRLAAWVLSASMAALSGVLYAHLILAFAPQQFFFDLTFLLLVMVIIGGPTVSGAVVGASVVTLLTEVLRRGEQGFGIGPIRVEEAFGLTSLVLGVLVLVMVILRPQGLLGRWELDELLAKGAARLRRMAGGRRPSHPASPAGDASGPGDASPPEGVATAGRVAGTTNDSVPHHFRVRGPDT